MKALGVATSPHPRRLLRFVVWGLLMALVLALLPYLVEELIRLADGLTGPVSYISGL
jgi:hypothetical protein